MCKFNWHFLMVSGNRRNWAVVALFVLLTCVVIGLAAITYLLDPNKIHYTICPFHYLTGLYCGTCGGTRAAHELLHGKWRQAIAYNPILIFFLIPGALIVWCHWLIRLSGGKTLFTPLTRSALVVLVILLLTFMVIRNLPFKIFASLRPHLVSWSAEEGSADAPR